MQHGGEIWALLLKAKAAAQHAVAALPPSLTYIPVRHCRRQRAGEVAEEEAAYKKGQKGHSGLRWEQGGLIPSCSSLLHTSMNSVVLFVHFDHEHDS